MVSMVRLATTSLHHSLGHLEPVAVAVRVTVALEVLEVPAVEAPAAIQVPSDRPVRSIRAAVVAAAHSDGSEVAMADPA